MKDGDYIDLLSEISDDIIEPSEFHEEDDIAEIEARYGDNAFWVYDEDNTKAYPVSDMVEAHKKSAAELRERKEQIRQEALRQTDINLAEEIPLDELRALVSLLVKKYDDSVKYYARRINSRFTGLLKAGIPRKVLSAYKAYPDIFRRSPGFIYQTTSEDESAPPGLLFWVTPDIPAFFEQGEELTYIFKSAPLHLIKSLDTLVRHYHKCKDQRDKKELRFAGAILQRRVKTYSNLLKLNPLWFKLLYDYKQQQNDNNTVSI